MRKRQFTNKEYWSACRYIRTHYDKYPLFPIREIDLERKFTNALLRYLIYEKILLYKKDYYSSKDMILSGYEITFRGLWFMFLELEGIKWNPRRR